MSDFALMELCLGFALIRRTTGELQEFLVIGIDAQRQLVFPPVICEDCRGRQALGWDDEEHLITDAIGAIYHTGAGMSCDPARRLFVSLVREAIEFEKSLDTHIHTQEGSR